MANHPLTKIYEAVREYGIVFHKSRQEFLCELLSGIIKSRSVVFTEVAEKIRLPAKDESIERRIQRFFQKANFDFLQLGAFMLSFIHHKRLLVSIDRTEWDFGNTEVSTFDGTIETASFI